MKTTLKSACFKKSPGPLFARNCNQSQIMSKRIAIIGAGASGLPCIKEALESGFIPICFEKTSYTGGLWRYHDDDEEGVASVMKSTIINSSKEMSAFSDFPPPKELPNYCHNSLLVKYFDAYAEQNGVVKHIKFNSEVVKITPSNDHEKSGNWIVRVRNTKTNECKEEIFNGVMVATGHHVKPIIPTFKGQDKFKGKIVHTHSYKKPAGYEDLNVLVVGIGNSGGDAAVELSMVAKNCYLSTRRGVWMLWRVGPNGEPFDSLYLRRYLDYLNRLTPYRLKNCIAECKLNGRFNHKKYGLKPSHRVFAQHPMVNDALPNRILSGTVIIKGDIEEFVEDGVIFKGESKVTPVDAVILATGYEVSFPFLDESILSTKDNEVKLYKYMFNPNLPHPHTLAFIGLIQAVGPAIPVSEMQARWFVHLMQGKSQLPSPQKMMKDIDKKRRELAKRYFAGPRHTMQIDWIAFMDELASQFGAKPSVCKYLFTDPVLFYHLLFGPCVPYNWRLTGPGAWKGARNAIVQVQERIDAALRTSSTKSLPVANGKAK